LPLFFQKTKYFRYWCLGVLGFSLGLGVLYLCAGFLFLGLLYTGGIA